ncbi:MAG: substrate-binding domain-containing protein [Nitrospiraceae bacterium]|nr:substrate-binding domain-containing protein [Nitrospiraceae bacterium]
MKLRGVFVFMLLAAAFLLTTPYPHESFAAGGKVLDVYGPSGPLAPMRECADAFSRMKGVTVNVITGPDTEWIDKAKKDADIIFAGAQYELTNFMLKNPGLIDKHTRIEIYPRGTGILVREGNPKKIRSLYDLTKKDIHILEVNGGAQIGLWEDAAGLVGLIPKIQNNIAVPVTSSKEAIDMWNSQPELDAWITFESWHYRLPANTDLVRLPDKERIYRCTPAAITTHSKNRALAAEFIKFLKSAQGHKIFQRWGWK